MVSNEELVAGFRIALRRAAPSQPEGAEPVTIDRELLAAIQAYRDHNSKLLMAQAIILGATPEKGVTIPIDPRMAEAWNSAVEAQKRLYDLTDARLSAGAAAPDEGEAWQPIATAPRDGSEVLAWEPGIGRMVLFFNVSREAPEGVWIDGLSGEDFHPSLWWPVLPPAPKGEEGKP